MFPPISEQEFFGYSDATPSIFQNNEKYLKNLSLVVNKRMNILDQLRVIFNQNF